MSFHPFDHIIGFAGLGQKSLTSKMKICIYKHSKEATPKVTQFASN